MFKPNNPESSLVKFVRAIDQETGVSQEFFWGKYHPPFKGILTHLVASRTYEMRYHMGRLVKFRSLTEDFIK